MQKMLSDAPLEESERAVLDFGKHSSKLADIIINSPPTFSVGIFGEWGIGKTSLMRMIEKKLGANPKIIPVWFNAWKYEREEYLAVVPLLRTISLAIEQHETSKGSNWRGVRQGFDRALIAFLASVKFKVGFENIASIEVDCREIIDRYRGKFKDGEIGTTNNIYLHANDFLAEALTNIRKTETMARIVVFIDDLDRCLPSNALEVLESIKSFFDIEGIIFVIGMSPKSIEHLIEEKHFHNPNIKGLDYLEKIVQLPFHIPPWSLGDISEFIKYTLRQEIDSSLEFNEDTVKLISYAVKKSPREVKRLVNSIILSKAIFNEPPLDKLIAVQALRFRPEWNPFLDFIMDYATKQQFLNKYMDSLKEDKNETAKKEDFSKEYFELLKIYPNLFDSENELGKFLDIGGAARILLDIDNMEGYRRALDPFDIRKFFGKGEKVHYDKLETYENATHGIRIRYPATWKKHEGSGEILVSFSPPQKSGMQREEIGNFIIRRKRNFQSLAEAITEITEERKRNSQEGKFHIDEERHIELANIPAYIMKIRRTPNRSPNLGIPLKSIICILTKNNNTYILAYHQREEKYFDYVPPIEKMIESFELI